MLVFKYVELLRFIATCKCSFDIEKADERVKVDTSRLTPYWVTGGMRAGRTGQKGHPIERQERGRRGERESEIWAEIKSRRKRRWIDTRDGRIIAIWGDHGAAADSYECNPCALLRRTWQPTGSVRFVRRGNAILMEHLSWFYTRRLSINRDRRFRRHSWMSLNEISSAPAVACISRFDVALRLRRSNLSDRRRIAALEISI